MKLDVDLIKKSNEIAANADTNTKSYWLAFVDHMVEAGMNVDMCDATSWAKNMTSLVDTMGHLKESNSTLYGIGGELIRNHLNLATNVFKDKCKCDFK